MDELFHNCCKEESRFHHTVADLLHLIEQVAKNVTPLSFKADQTLLYEGHTPYGLFIVKKGEVCFEKNGRTQLLNDMKPTMLGFKHLLSDTPYCTSCKAVSHVEAIFLPKKTFQDALEGGQKKNFKSPLA